MNNSQDNLNLFSNLPHHSIPKWTDLPEIDLYMDQVIGLMEKYLVDNASPDSKLITPSMINNYVKLGIMPAPVKKKYSREHLAYLVIICSLKQVMPIPNIKALIEQKLQKSTIAETLDFYSDLYDFTYQTLLKTCKTYLESKEYKIENAEDTSLFTAIAAANCIQLSNTIFYINHPQKQKNTDKKKIKENKK